MYKLLFNSILHIEKCNNAFLAPYNRKKETFNGLSDFVEKLLDIKWQKRKYKARKLSLQECKTNSFLGTYQYMSHLSLCK